MLFVLLLGYQLWWTNLQARAEADGARQALEQQWGGPVAGPHHVPKVPPHYALGQRFAILYVPKLRLTVPIAEGTDKRKVLDHGLVGHVTGSALPDGMPGNVALAAHRNTHGEPFRHLPELGKGDEVVVETSAAYYTYRIEGGIQQTSPDNVTVLKAVPQGSPFTRRGPYLTLLTCTPDFTSWYRLVRFGELVAVRPRSEGPPPVVSTMS